LYHEQSPNGDGKFIPALRRRGLVCLFDNKPTISSSAEFYKPQWHHPFPNFNNYFSRKVEMFFEKLH